MFEFFVFLGIFYICVFENVWIIWLVLIVILLRRSFNIYNRYLYLELIKFMLRKILFFLGYVGLIYYYILLYFIIYIYLVILGE